MMQDSTVRPTDVALADDGDWHGRKMPPGTPWLTRAGAWHAWRSGSLVPLFDLREEMDERRGREWRIVRSTLFLCILAAGATWAIWAGR